MGRGKAIDEKIRSIIINLRKRGSYIIKNLPSTVSYKLLNEKCSEFGEVQSFEAKGPGSILLTYQADWQAEKAIKNLDKARIDGRMIDARLFF